MIFVTVGTTIPFDELLEAVDDCVARGIIDEPVVCQTGNSTYEPRHCEWFRFRQTIEDMIEDADLIISHGGATALELLLSGRRFMVFPNPHGADDHQGQFLDFMARKYDLIWSRDPGELEALLPKARGHRPKPFAEPRLHDHLKAFLLS